VAKGLSGPQEILVGFFTSLLAEGVMSLIDSGARTRPIRHRRTVVTSESELFPSWGSEVDDATFAELEIVPAFVGFTAMVTVAV